MSRYNTRLSNMTDDEISKFFDNIERHEFNDTSDESDGDFSSDDDQDDPTYAPENEVDGVITDCLNEMESANTSANIVHTNLLDLPNTIDNERPSTSSQSFTSNTSNSKKRNRFVPYPFRSKRGRRANVYTESEDEEEVDAIEPNMVFERQFFDLQINSKSNDFKNLTWRHKSLRLHTSEVQFRGDITLPPFIQQLKRIADKV